jgi:hypothetical protein
MQSTGKLTVFIANYNAKKAYQAKGNLLRGIDNKTVGA